MLFQHQILKLRKEEQTAWIKSAVSIMDKSNKHFLTETVKNFRLPRYSEITDIGLYLEQVTRFVNSYLVQLGCPEITPSMVSNYVKRKTIPGPFKKAYGKDAIAYLMFVSFAKTAMSMDDLRVMRFIQEESYTLDVAYDYFCSEFENLLQFVFGLKDEPEHIGRRNTPEKELLRSALLSISHKIYLDCCLAELRERNNIK